MMLRTRLPPWLGSRLGDQVEIDSVEAWMLKSITVLRHSQSRDVRTAPVTPRQRDQALLKMSVMIAELGPWSMIPTPTHRARVPRIYRLKKAIYTVYRVGQIATLSRPRILASQVQFQGQCLLL